MKKRIKVNGNWQDISASTLAELINELDYTDSTIATARNHEFVRATERVHTQIIDGDEIEILVPMQGG